MGLMGTLAFSAGPGGARVGELSRDIDVKAAGQSWPEVDNHGPGGPVRTSTKITLFSTLSLVTARLLPSTASAAENHPIVGCGDLVRGFDIPGAVTHVESATVVTGTPEYCDVKDFIAPAVHFEFRAPHVLSLAAKRIIETYYGAAPKKSYFSGCTNGGREGLLLAQRYPTDFNGSGDDAANFHAPPHDVVHWAGDGLYEIPGPVAP